MGVPRIETGPMTVEDFLAFTEGRPDDERWELIEGTPVMNATPVYRHQLIVRNLIFQLDLASRERRCDWVAIPGIGVRVSRTSAPVPDVLVRPLDDLDGAVCDDMIVAFEVLSPSTFNRDLRWKHYAYTGRASLQEYIVVAQDRAEVVVFSRAAAFEELRVSGTECSIFIASLNVSVSLAEIYRDISF